SLADACTPNDDVAAYTQAIMDLGSTVCTRRRPACDACPLREGCIALQTGRQYELPSPRPRRERPHRQAFALLLVRQDGAVLLEERPARGLWGGLASLPMFDSEAEALASCKALVGHPDSIELLSDYSHAFTHFDLTLRPLLVRADVTSEV